MNGYGYGGTSLPRGAKLKLEGSDIAPVGGDWSPEQKAAWKAAYADAMAYIEKVIESGAKFRAYFEEYDRPATAEDVRDAVKTAREDEIVAFPRKRSLPYDGGYIEIEEAKK